MFTSWKKKFAMVQPAYQALLFKMDKLLFAPNLLLVSGNGRNSGKTTLITRIISHFHGQIGLTAIKITPHFHDLEENVRMDASSYIIEKELNVQGAKDSSRMLAAGAKEVFFVSARDAGLPYAFQELLQRLDPAHLWICESGGLRSLVKPGLFLVVRKNDQSPWKEGIRQFLGLADRMVTFDGKKFDFDLREILFLGNSWRLKT